MPFEHSWLRSPDVDDIARRFQDFSAPPPFSRPEGDDQEAYWIKNNSGSSQNRFAILGIDNVLYPPGSALEDFKNEIVLVGSTPSTASHKGKFAILLDDVRANEYARCYASCLCQVKVDVTDVNLQHAEIKNGSTSELVTDPEGSAFIVWREGGTGVQWAVIRFDRFGAGHIVWAFELAEDLPQWNQLPVWACKKDWDPSLHTGWGGYTTNPNIHFKVADWREVGYFGYAGAEGAARIRQCDNGIVGVIVDLECPPECLCGVVNPYDVDNCDPPS